MVFFLVYQYFYFRGWGGNIKQSTKIFENVLSTLKRWWVGPALRSWGSEVGESVVIRQGW